MEKAKEILTAHGAEVSDVELPADQGFDKILNWHASVLAAEGKASFLGQYRTNKGLLHEDIVGHVENKKNISRADQLEAYDNCAWLRPVFDSIAAKYDMIITPSVVDEAPKGLENTGDMVCPPLPPVHPHRCSVTHKNNSLSAQRGQSSMSPRSTSLASRARTVYQLALPP